MDEKDALIGFVANVVGEAPLRVEESLGSGFVRLRVSEAERRQAKHDIRWVEDVAIEILRNARDAGAKNIYLASAREGAARTLVCIDDGCGMPASMFERVFEARVTSKLDTMCMDRWGVHGRGMALFSIRQNARLAEVCSSAPGKGTALRVVCDCSVLSERADQSSWPQVDKDADGRLCVVRGPHNVIRTAVEFALDVPPDVNVFLGSPTDVLATLVHRGDAVLAAQGLPFGGDVESVPVWLRPALVGDARVLTEHAAALGLEVSERTCYRILRGELPPLEPLRRVAAPSSGGASGPVDLLKDRRGLKVSPSDLADFTASLERSFNVLGDRYYLSLKGHPRVRIGRGAVTVVFEVEKED